MKVTLPLVLACLSSCPDRHISPALPFRSFDFDYGLCPNANDLGTSNCSDRTAVVKLPPGCTPSASSTALTYLKSRHSDTAFSGHGNTIENVGRNRYVFAMQVTLAFILL
ncbi:hypothetical protein MRX96_049456 [Rhipicephalus microplus]